MKNQSIKELETLEMGNDILNIPDEALYYRALFVAFKEFIEEEKRQAMFYRIAFDEKDWSGKNPLQETPEKANNLGKAQKTHGKGNIRNN